MTETTVYLAGDSVHVVAESNTAVDVQVFIICDDCREAYLEPAYYKFEPDACMTSEDTPDGSTDIQHMNTPEGCTGNMCPDCAGPYLTPDDEDDPRLADVLLKNEQNLR